jgi:hypothetical protein
MVSHFLTIWQLAQVAVVYIVIFDIFLFLTFQGGVLLSLILRTIGGSLACFKGPTKKQAISHFR